MDARRRRRGFTFTKMLNDIKEGALRDVYG